MPKIGVIFKKTFVVEAKDEVKAIEKAEGLLDKEFGDNQDSFTRVFKVIVIASECVEEYLAQERGIKRKRIHL